MTNDTLRAKDAIIPLADAIGIKVTFPENIAIMICNGQEIAIAGNSTWATIMEFVGYVFLTQYVKNLPSRFHFSRRIPAAIESAVKKYWRK